MLALVTTEEHSLDQENILCVLLLVFKEEGFAEKISRCGIFFRKIV